ncbi:MAG: hypothetical protein Unbinned3585contig1000_33 [Prokaryotic dsDNA virus sp.]|jgi:hypothetical protein|nr:MAG: hypothetical protein Unbinned3585contig1000_33 [Prokaryotic dsDNA virus sp.]|tara:strand:+ start:22502 stop:23122 length:621 start_codon:yes stop_codon:yes gene_type:complete
MAYIGFFPVTLGFKALKFQQKTITKKTETASGRTVRATNATTLWQGVLAFPSTSSANFRAVQAFVARCQGSLNEFDIVLPTISDTSGSYPGQVTFPSAASTAAGSTSIAVTSDQTSKTILRAGDVIRFFNHTKVYMVTEDVATNGAGAGTINFQPALVTAVDSDSAGEPISVNQVAFRFIISNDLQEYGYDNQGFVNFEIDVQEVY